MDKKEIRKEIENYKKIVAHLTEHINEGNFDNLDVSQSNLLKKEIKRLQPKLGGKVIDLTFTKALDVPLNDVLYEWTNPKEAQKKAFKYLGKNAIIYKSSNPKKKFMILDPNKNKMVHFGQINFQDFLKHKNLDRRNRFLKRTANMRGEWRDNKYSANNLSREILW